MWRLQNTQNQSLTAHTHLLMLNLYCAVGDSKELIIALIFKATQNKYEVLKLMYVFVVQRTLRGKTLCCSFSAVLNRIYFVLTMNKNKQ